MLLTSADGASVDLDQVSQELCALSSEDAMEIFEVLVEQLDVGDVVAVVSDLMRTLKTLFFTLI